MTSSSPSGAPCSTPPSWTAMALFVVTLLASQVLQHFLKDHNDNNNLRTEDFDDDDDEDSDARYYKRDQSLPERFDRYTWMRRRHDRLSFDHIDICDLSEPSKSKRRTTNHSPSTSPPPPPYVPGNKRLSLVVNDLDGRVSTTTTTVLGDNAAVSNNNNNSNHHADCYSWNSKTWTNPEMYVHCAFACTSLFFTNVE